MKRRPRRARPAAAPTSGGGRRARWRTPVTSSAAQTVAPCGTARSPQARAIAVKAPQAASISTSVSAGGVVARRVALHQDDLQRVRRGAREDREVARDRAKPRRRKTSRADRGEARPRSDRGGARIRNNGRPNSGVEDDVEPGDEAGGGDSRSREAAVWRPCLTAARRPSSCDAGTAGAQPQAPRTERRRRRARWRRAHRRECEERVQLDGVARPGRT